MAKKKVKVDIEKFLDAVGLLYRLGKLNATDIDYSCVFEKDLTITQKKKLPKHMEIEVLLNSMVLCPSHYGGKRRKDLIVTHNDKGQWGAELVKPTKSKKQTKVK